MTYAHIISHNTRYVFYIYSKVVIAKAAYAQNIAHLIVTRKPGGGATSHIGGVKEAYCRLLTYNT